MSRIFEGTFTHRFKVVFTKPELFDEKFFEEFSSYMFAVDSIEDIAKHAVHNYAFNGSDTFVEGIGDLKEMGIKFIDAHETETEVEEQQ